MRHQFSPRMVSDLPAEIPKVNHAKPRSNNSADKQSDEKTEEQSAKTAQRWQWGNYWRTSPLAIMGVFFYFILWMLTGSVAPDSLANWLWPDSYLLVQLLLAGGNFFVFTYFFQSVAWGKWATITVAMIVFFRCAHFIFTPLLAGSLIVIAAIWWYILIWRQKSAPMAKTDKV